MAEWVRRLRLQLRLSWRRISSSALIRNIAYLTGGVAGGQFIVAASSPIITRLFTPSEFGVLAIYTAFLGIISGAAALRFDFAIPLPEAKADAEKLLRIALVSVVAIAFVVLLVVLGAGGHFVRYWGLGEVSPYLWLLPIGLLGVGVYRTFNYWAIRVKQFGAIARTKVVQSVGMVVTQAGTGLVGVGAVGLIVGQIVGQVAGVRALAGVYNETKSEARSASFDEIKKIATRYRDFPRYSGPGVILNSAGLHIPALCFAGIFSAQVAGWYMLAERVINKPVSLIGRATSQVYLGEAAALKQGGGDMLRPLYLKAAGFLFVLALVPSILLVLYAPPLFGFVFGSEWIVAGEYVRMLIPMLLARFTISPLAETLNIIEEQALQMWWEFARLLLVVGAFGAAFYLALQPLSTVLLFSCLMAVAYIGLAFATLVKI